MRRALERVLQWESGSIDAILSRSTPTPTQPKGEVTAQDRFSLARQVVSLKATFAKHAEAIGPEAREALVSEATRSAREAEESIIKMMPWLDDSERGEAIALLVELRTPLYGRLARLGDGRRVGEFGPGRPSSGRYSM